MLLRPENKQDGEIVALKKDMSQARSRDGKAGDGKKSDDLDEKEKASLAELDRRIGELEDLIGSSSIALDEVLILRWFRS